MSGDGGTIKYPLFELEQAIEQIMFSVWIGGDDDDAVSYELILDEVRFEE